jgi:hypothetical protein
MHAEQTGADVEPIVKSIAVPWSAEDAFRRFTSEIGSWWPLETHSLFGDKTVTVTMEGREGGRLFETDVDGNTRLWGSVTAWQPSEFVAFTWHLDRDPATTQRIEVRFSAADEGTVVELTHRDWHVFGEQASEQRSYYAGGWDGVLGRYTATS